MEVLLNKVKGAVSRKKKRLQVDDYDLDLTYITEHIIAMGFPAEKLEGIYRNNMEDVVRFLEQRHKDHYKVYNLCIERSYEHSKFQNRVAHYPFVDHNPPHVQLIPKFCEDVDEWLKKHEENVAVIHCKAGKGRTGVMISSYLLHTGKCPTAEKALNLYDTERTHNRKGVTIPSQRRYVHYYEKLLKSDQQYNPVVLQLKGIKLITLPRSTYVAPVVTVYKSSEFDKGSVSKVYESSPVENINKSEEELCLELPEKVSVSGDTLICFFNKSKMKLGGKERMFQFWFNTFFVTEEGKENGKSRGSLSCKPSDNPKYTGEKEKLKRNASAPVTSEQPNERKLRAASSFTFPESNCVVLRLTKMELDKANKDRNHKEFDEKFEVICYFEKSAAQLTATLSAIPSSPGHDLSEVGSEDKLEDLSDTESDTDPDENADSTNL